MKTTTDQTMALGRPAAKTEAFHTAGSQKARPCPDDLALIRRVAAKDRQAFETLYQRYYPRLFGYLLKLLKHRELTEEVLNDVMVVVWHEASHFRHQSRLSTWIFGIAYHKALKALSRTSEPSPESLPTVPSDQEAPEDAMIRQETYEALAQILLVLSPEQRAVVELTFYRGFSYRQIAELTGCPVNTVKTRMLSARKRLSQLLLGIRQHLA